MDYFYIPFAGYRNYYDGKVYNTGSYAYYWSSSPRGGSNPYYAWYLYFYSSYVNPSYYSYRAYGQSVRCFKDSYVASPSTYTLTFVSNGGSEVESQTVNA